MKIIKLILPLIMIFLGFVFVGEFIIYAVWAIVFVLSLLLTLYYVNFKRKENALIGCKQNITYR